MDARRIGWSQVVQVMAQQYPRLAIVGGPRTGKTTLARSIRDRHVIGTDDFMALPWEEVPGKVIEAAGAAGRSFVVEGVQAARALRKGLVVDAVVVMTRPKTALTEGQASMTKGVATVLADWQAAHPTAVIAVEPG